MHRFEIFSETNNLILLRIYIFRENTAFIFFLRFESNYLKQSKWSNSWCEKNTKFQSMSLRTDKSNIHRLTHQLLFQNSRTYFHDIVCVMQIVTRVYVELRTEHNITSPSQHGLLPATERSTNVSSQHMWWVNHTAALPRLSPASATSAAFCHILALFLWRYFRPLPLWGLRHTIHIITHKV